MSTYAVGISAPTLTAASAARKPRARGLFRRVLDRLVEARMLQAEIEVRRQLALLPPHLQERFGYSLKKGSELKNERERPFGC